MRHRRSTPGTARLIRTAIARCARRPRDMQVPRGSPLGPPSWFLGSADSGRLYRSPFRLVDGGLDRPHCRAGQRIRGADRYWHPSLSGSGSGRQAAEHGQSAGMRPQAGVRRFAPGGGLRPAQVPPRCCSPTKRGRDSFVRGRWRPAVSDVWQLALALAIDERSHEAEPLTPETSKHPGHASWLRNNGPLSLKGRLHPWQPSVRPRGPNFHRVATRRLLPCSSAVWAQRATALFCPRSSRSPKP